VNLPTFSLHRGLKGGCGVGKKQLVLWIVVSAGIGLALWFRIALFNAGCANMPATDDECIIALQAKQIARGEFSLLMLAQPYMFPLETYLMAPVINLLPRTAFGARVMAFGCGLLSLFLAWLILRRWGRLQEVWPGFLLLLAGSPFLMMLQYGLALPGYPSLILLSSLMVWLAQRHKETASDVSRLAAFGVGFLGGVACSVTMLALPVLVMAGAMIGLHWNWRVARWTIPLVLLGAVVGLIPHWLAQVLYGGEGSAIFRMDSWRDALDSFVTPTLSVTVPGVLGLGCPVTPGSLDRVDGFLLNATVYGWMWFLSLVGVTLKAIIVEWPRYWRDRWLSLDAGLVFVGVSWMSLIMFLFSSRSGAESYRYLTLIAWAWPFLIVYWYVHSGQIMRVAIGTFTVLVLVINLHNADGLLTRWRDPAFTQQLKAHDLVPVIHYLDSRGIRHAYSTYADTYRITFATDERIVCAQLYNERFPSWPLPYKTTVVDPATNVAYVLSADNRFTPSLFERDMESVNVTYRVQSCGAYKVYTDFASVQERTDTVIFSQVDASHSPDKAADRINDPAQFWRSEGALQQTGMWVSVEWSEPRQVGHVLLSHGIFSRDSPDKVHVYFQAKGAWVKFPDPLSCVSVPFMFSNGHPVYGGEMTRLDFPYPIKTTGLKFEIATPRVHQAWTIYQISLTP